MSDIWVDANDIAIATHGRGFYVLDNIEPLRQYGAPVTSAADAYLFKPGEAVRSAGPARITYWLKKPAQKLTLDILDGNGQVVRTFNGAMPDAGRGRGQGCRVQRVQGATVQGATVQGATVQGAGGATGTNPMATAEPEEEEGGGRGRGGPPTASMAAGVNRFAWDLQVRAGDAVPGHGALGRDDERADGAARRRIRRASPSTAAR